MFLMIDWGNTSLKFLLLAELPLLSAHPRSREIERVEKPCELLRIINSESEQSSISNILIASVRSSEDNKELVDALSEIGAPIFYAKTSDSNVGITCAYKDPTKLGIDRWLAMIGAFQPQYASIGVVDIGSAITLDVVDLNGQHCGGQIVPGLNLAANSLLETGKVRFNALSSEICDFRLGQNTAECVQFGVHSMLSGYLSHAILKAISQHNVQKWFVTGGDSSVLTSLFEEIRQSTAGIANFVFVSDLVFIGLAKLYLEKTKIDQSLM
jgi:type III pantothenate kinase